MSDQLDRLIKAAESPGIVIQVLPYCAHDHPGAEGLLLRAAALPLKDSVAFMRAIRREPD